MIRWKAISMTGLIVAVLLLGGYPAWAQQSPRGGKSPGVDPRMEQMADMMFKDVDTNHDGKITRNEWQAFQNKQFEKLDKSGKGFINKDDVIAGMENMRKEQMARGGPQGGGPAPGQ